MRTNLRTEYCASNYIQYFKKVSHSRYIRGEVTRATGRKIPGRGGVAVDEGG